MSAPSPKEIVVEDSTETQDVSAPTEAANASQIQPPHLDSTEDPSSTPTATANSPRPSRRPVERLTSILPRSSSNIPSLANPDGESRAATLKYKPKTFQRKSRETREAAERADAELQAAKYAAEHRAGASERGAYSARGRGRGGYSDMSRWKEQRFNTSHTATGHLGGSTLMETSSGRRGRGGFGGRGGGGGGGGGSGDTGDRVEGGGGGGGRGGGGGGRGGHSAAPESTPTRVKKEPTIKGEKDKDGDVVMGSSMAKSKSKKAKIKKEDQPTYVSSGDEFDSDGKERMDIERINLVTDDEESDEGLDTVSENAKGKKRQRLPQPRLDLLRPIRIQRQEHVERAVGVNTDASSLTSAELRRKAKERNEAGGGLFLSDEDETEILRTQKAKGKRKPKDVEFVKDERKWKGVYQDEDDKDSIVKIKDEPKEEADIMLVNKPLGHEGPERMAVDEEEAIPLSGAMQNTLPDVSAAVPQHSQDLDATARDIAEIENLRQDLHGDGLQQPDQERARAGRYHHTDLPLTDEEKGAMEAELSVDLDEIYSILADIESRVSTSRRTPATKTDDDDDDPVDLSHEASAHVSIIEGSNYTFQLPPLLPSLRDASRKPAPPEKPPKPKPTPPAHEPPKPSAPTNPFAAPIKEDPDIKPDPDALAPAPNIPHTYISGGIIHPSGHAGRFRIHKGGKLSANWGGMGMEVAKSGDGQVATPQELVMTGFEAEVAKVEDEGGVWEERVRVGKRGWGVGMARPGFVAVPGLGRLLF